MLIYGARHGDVPKLVDLSGRFCVRDGVLQRVSLPVLGQPPLPHCPPCASTLPHCTVSP